MWDGWLTFFAILRISSLRVSACQLAVLETVSVKMKGRNGTNNVKGLTNHLHNIFSASKLQGKEIDMEDSFYHSLRSIDAPMDLTATTASSLLMSNAT